MTWLSEDIRITYVPAGRDDMYDAGMKFWHVLASHSSYDGLYCMGIDTANADCTDPKISIGASADSMYEYMLKQWLLSGKKQEVCVVYCGAWCLQICKIAAELQNSSFRLLSVGCVV